MNSLSGSTALVIVLLTAVMAVAAGVMFYLARRNHVARTQQKQQPKRRLPTQWPLNPRPVVNSAERQVWQWLQTVFPEYHIMVKLPLTRFTMPRQPDGEHEWFDVLSSAYCSFAICDEQGQVVGCVDVQGPRGLSSGNRQLKQNLLAQCGIGYWVLTAATLPRVDAMRTEFLGSASSSLPARPSTRADLDSVRLQLHEVLDRNRSHRQRRPDGETDSAYGDLTPWPQQDSFLGSLDSRRAALDKL